MKIEIRNALTVGDCTKALDLSGQLYASPYTDNDVRMLYASAHACNIGIRLYDLVDRITSADFSSGDAIFRSLVKLFPSRTALDSRLQSGWFAQDALQSMLKPGAVVGPSDQTDPGSHNPGSLLSRDRTDDANTYLVFIAMSEVGTALNRYGYLPGDDPAANQYKKTVNLAWTDQASVRNDASGAACGLASSMLNMFDGIHALVTLVSGDTSSSLNGILTLLESGTNLAARTQCKDVDGFTVAQCEAAIARLRFRGACAEQNPVASVAAGIISGINGVWAGP